MQTCQVLDHAAQLSSNNEVIIVGGRHGDRLFADVYIDTLLKNYTVIRGQEIKRLPSLIECIRTLSFISDQVFQF